MPGNGSDENLFFALRAFCDETHPLAYADITYGCYSVWFSRRHLRFRPVTPNMGRIMSLSGRTR